MKIKILKFEVSNAASSPFDEDKNKPWFSNCIKRLKTPSEIQTEINKFCADKEVVDIKTNTVDVHYHNNGRGNTIELWVTITYK